MGLLMPGVLVNSPAPIEDNATNLEAKRKTTPFLKASKADFGEQRVRGELSRRCRIVAAGLLCPLLHA